MDSFIRRLIIAVGMFVLMPLSVYAEESDHLKFMGIPIDGTADELEPLLNEKDFEKSGLSDYIGHFYGHFCVLEVGEDEQTGAVNQVLVRYNQLIAHYSSDELVAIYRNIAHDLKNKYKTAKIDEGDGSIILSLPEGYIYCSVFSTIFGNMGGGVNLIVQYVDKANSSDYQVPALRRNADDL